MNRADFIASARSCIGTPFHHQGRVPGVGLDCVGLIFYAATSNGYEVTDWLGYPPMPSRGSLDKAISMYCDEIDATDVQPGDLMKFAFIRDSQHIGIVSCIDPMRIIHSWSNALGVVETGIDPAWQARLRGCFRLREIQ